MVLRILMPARRWPAVKGALAIGLRLGVVLVFQQANCTALAQTAAVPEAASSASASSLVEVRQHLVARLNLLASELDNEAKSVSAVAKQINSSQPAKTSLTMEKILQSKSDLTPLLTSEFQSFSPLFKGTQAAASAGKDLVASSTESKSQSLANYAQYLRGLSDEINHAPPERALEMLKVAYVPSDIAIVIDPLSSPNGAPQSQTGLLPQVAGQGAEPTLSYPAVGALLYSDGNGGLDTRCTGTLVAPDAVLTAAHCVQEGPNHPGAPIKVYFHHAGVFDAAGEGNLGDIEDYDLNPGFKKDYGPNDFSSYSDLALIFLKTSVVGIAHAELNDISALPPNSSGRIVGFGYHNKSLSDPTASSSAIDSTTGIKTHAQVTTSACGSGSPSEVICWSYDSNLLKNLYGTFCGGDSGGPLISQIGGKWRLAGVNSASNCTSGNLSAASAYSVEVFGFSNWIDNEIAKHESAPLAQGAHYAPPLEPFSELPSGVWGLSFFVLDNHGSWDTSFIVKGGGLSSMRVSVNASDRSTRMRLNVGSGSHACTQMKDSPPVECPLPDPPEGDWSFKLEGGYFQQFQVVVDGFPKKN
jgi:V8-like Glu-specific endopeptidase